MKAGVFKLNMHPREYFDRNPFIDDGKGGRRRGEIKGRSKSAQSSKRPFKYSSPGKQVCFEILSQKYFLFISFFSSVEIKMVVLINFLNVVIKILMSLVRCLLK
jgi:hypothetical protein